MSGSDLYNAASKGDGSEVHQLIVEKQADVNYKEVRHRESRSLALCAKARRRGHERCVGCPLRLRPRLPPLSLSRTRSLSLAPATPLTLSHTHARASRGSLAVPRLSSLHVSKGIFK